MFCEKHGKPIRWGKVVRILLIVIIAVALFGRGILYLFDTATGPITSFSNYLKFTWLDGWLVDEPYVIFPSKETAEAANSHSYLHKKLMAPTFFFDNDVLTYLSCVYDAESFAMESQRLAALCGEPVEGWRLPAYVYCKHIPNGFSSYALLDEQHDTIHYFSVQGTMLLKRYIPETLYHELQQYFIDKHETGKHRGRFSVFPVKG